MTSGRAAGDLRVPAVLRVSHSSVVTAWRERDRALRSRGIDVTLCTARRWDEGGTQVTFAAAGDDFAAAVRTWGRHPNAFVYDPVALWRILGRRSWDLIDLHEEPFSLAAAEVLALAALRRRRAPFVFYSAQNLAKRYPLPFRWIERHCLRRASAAYVCNRAAARVLASKGLRGPAVVLPLGVEVDRFDPPDRDPPSGTLRVGYVGRLDVHKGVHVLLAALAEEPGSELTVVGDGPAAAALRGRAEGLGLAARVRFVGFVDHQDLPAVYRRLDVLAVPSVPVPGWDEQFCRTAVEAMASGVPVVASRTGALPEVVGGGGLLVTPDDAEALAAALRRLRTEPGLWAALRAAALADVGRFGWGAVAGGQAELYRRALGEHPGEAP